MHKICYSTARDGLANGLLIVFKSPYFAIKSRKVYEQKAEQLGLPARRPGLPFDKSNGDTCLKRVFIPRYPKVDYDTRASEA